MHDWYLPPPPLQDGRHSHVDVHTRTAMILVVKYPSTAVHVDHTCNANRAHQTTTLAHQWPVATRYDAHVSCTSNALTPNVHPALIMPTSTAQVMPWFTQMYTSVNTGSLLLHPNTGCEYEDHSIWALWAGGSWPLNMDIFTQWTQVVQCCLEPA